MTGKKLKYKQYLERFPFCPSTNFMEVERDAYRWTNYPLSESDFIPINIKTEPPPRILDDSDKMCMAYGLSMFNSLSDSILKYQRLYMNLRLHQREHFMQDKGSHISLIKLTKDDGVADLPNENNYGHYTFHEYSDTNLIAKVIEQYNIFNEDGKFDIK